MYNSKKDLRREDIKIGDKVMPVTPAGVCLRDKPTTGKYKEIHNVPCVFTGVGTVLKLKTIIIDYDSWPDDDTKLGKIEYIDCFIKCKNGTGWVGRGALMKKEGYLYRTGFFVCNNWHIS